MNTIKYKLLILFVALSWVACDVDYQKNPNEATNPPTTALFNNSTVSLMSLMNDEWWEGRFTLVVMQYWAQTNYTDEDRYQFRTNVAERWEAFYGAMEDYRLMIKMNTDEATKNGALAYGPNEGQIAMCRIMLSYMFDIMTSTYGDLPYWSYGAQDNPDFQGLQATEGILTPKYATQRDIFVDILKELSEAQDQLASVAGESVIGGDPVYDGDLDKWRKFANSLRLRIAMKLMGTSEDALAKAAFADAVADGVFDSNADNAKLLYENNSTNGAPFYKAFYVSNREDFSVAYPFMTLLKGQDLTTTTPKVNPFKNMIDPRLPIFSDQSIVVADGARAYPSLNAEMDKYISMPYGVQDAEAKAFKWWSFPGKEILKADFAVPMMDYSEVLFLLSEFKGWTEMEYQGGVRASMQKWGVAQADIDAYLVNLPPANQETVLTQKYIALYMQSHQAWTEYRRTGYPKFLVLPGESYTEAVIPGTGEAAQTYSYTFTPAVAGITDLPSRVNYSSEEQNLNKENYEAAVERLKGGDKITSKLWWMK